MRTDARRLPETFKVAVNCGKNKCNNVHCGTNKCNNVHCGTNKCKFPSPDEVIHVVQVPSIGDFLDSMHLTHLRRTCDNNRVTSVDIVADLKSSDINKVMMSPTRTLQCA
jgi:hypothetical protein